MDGRWLAAAVMGAAAAVSSVRGSAVRTALGFPKFSWSERKPADDDTLDHFLLEQPDGIWRLTINEESEWTLLSPRWRDAESIEAWEAEAFELGADEGHVEDLELWMKSRAERVIAAWKVLGRKPKGSFVRTNLPQPSTEEMEIPGCFRTDSGDVRCWFDATPFFREVDDARIVKLARDGFSHSMEAIRVMLYVKRKLKGTHDGKMLEEAWKKADYGDMSHEVEIDRGVAMAWISVHRLHLLTLIQSSGSPVRTTLKSPPVLPMRAVELRFNREANDDLSVLEANFPKRPGGPTGSAWFIQSAIQQLKNELTEAGLDPVSIVPYQVFKTAGMSPYTIRAKAEVPLDWSPVLLADHLGERAYEVGVVAGHFEILTKWDPSSR